MKEILPENSFEENCTESKICHFFRCAFRDKK